MRKWENYVREHLPLPEIAGLGEERIILELADHLEDLYREALARGLGEDEAEEIVRRKIGDFDVAAAELARNKGDDMARKVDRWVEGKEHRVRGRGGIWTMLADLGQDLRLSLRGLWKSYGFSLVVVLTLAVGIGANTAIFSPVNGILLEPLPFEEPERLVAIWNTLPGVGIEKFSTSAAIHFTYEEQSETLEDVGLWTAGRAVVTGLEEAANEQAMWVTEGTFRVLRVRPLLGRIFTPEDDTPAAPRTMILGHGYWQQRFGGDPGVIGRTLRVDGNPTEVIGVMPAGFRIVDEDAALYIPLRIDRSTVVAGQFWYMSVGRLAQGVTVDQVHADLSRLMPVAIE